MVSALFLSIEELVQRVRKLEKEATERQQAEKNYTKVRSDSDGYHLFRRC